MAKLQSTNDCPPFPEIEGVEFRHCPGYVGYAVSDDGRVWSSWKCMGYKRGWGIGNQWKHLRSAPDTGGYLCLTIRNDKGVRKTRTVHQLVLESFVGARQIGREACHNNGDRQDNRLENLRWDTRSANQLDSVRHGTSAGMLRGGNSPKAKLSNDDVLLIRECAKFIGCRRIAKLFKISKTHTLDIINNKTRPLS